MVAHVRDSVHIDGLLHPLAMFEIAYLLDVGSIAYLHGGACSCEFLFESGEELGIGYFGPQVEFVKSQVG